MYTVDYYVYTVALRVLTKSCISSYTWNIMNPFLPQSMRNKNISIPHLSSEKNNVFLLLCIEDGMQIPVIEGLFHKPL